MASSKRCCGLPLDLLSSPCPLVAISLESRVSLFSIVSFLCAPFQACSLPPNDQRVVCVRFSDEIIDEWFVCLCFVNTVSLHSVA